MYLCIFIFWLRAMQDLCWPGIEPRPLAARVRSLTTGPAGNSLALGFNHCLCDMDQASGNSLRGLCIAAAGQVCLCWFLLSKKEPSITDRQQKAKLWAGSCQERTWRLPRYHACVLSLFFKALLPLQGSEFDSSPKEQLKQLRSRPRWRWHQLHCSQRLI